MSEIFLSVLIQKIDRPIFVFGNFVNQNKKGKREWKAHKFKTYDPSVPLLSGSWYTAFVVKGWILKDKCLVRDWSEKESMSQQLIAPSVDLQDVPKIKGVCK